MNDNNPDYLTPEELSKRWKGVVAVRTLANWRSSGCAGLRYVKIGGRIAYRLADIIEWEESRTVTATNGYKATG